MTRTAAAESLPPKPGLRSSRNPSGIHTSPLSVLKSFTLKPVRLADDPDQRQAGDGAGDQAGDADCDEHAGESGRHCILEQNAARQLAEVGSQRPADDIGKHPGGDVRNFTTQDGILEESDDHSESNETDQHAERGFG